MLLIRSRELTQKHWCGSRRDTSAHNSTTNRSVAAAEAADQHFSKLT
jgi:hypothetical protein